MMQEKTSQTPTILEPVDDALDVVSVFKMPEQRMAETLRGLAPEDLFGLLLDVRDFIQHQDARFARMLDIGSALGNALHIDDLLRIIVEKTTQLMDAERSTLFLVDEESHELWSKIVQGNVNIEIRLQLGQGIAGWVALTGKSLNIRDAYRDPRFNPKVDENTGYVTRNILCQPIRNLQGDIIGVIQVLNRRKGYFTDEDENLLSAIASQAAIAIENSKLYLAAIERNMELIEIKDKLEHKVGELDVLYELERTINKSRDISEMSVAMFRRLLELVHASVGALTLREGATTTTYSACDRGEWRPTWVFEQRVVDGPVGLGGEAFRRRATLVCTHEDSELLEPLEVSGGAYGIEAENGIAVPLFDEEEVIGVLEIFNTINLDESGEVGFSEDDRKIISVVASQISGAVTAERRRLEEVKNERLASIGQMLSGVVHDFKNPMAIISGYVQLMSRADDAEMRKTYAKSILKQFEQLNSMTLELLAFARGDRNILLRKVFLHKFVEDVAELLRPELASYDVALELHLEYRNDVKMDPSKMKRAILNLARNAAESMAPGGGGTFTLRMWHDTSTDEVVFECGDTGPGIPPGIRDKLFESFVTHGKQNGTGLGLAIVKKIVEDHDGSISFETETGVGTTFMMRLPMGGATVGDS